MLITTALTGSETQAQALTWFQTVIDFYKGTGTYAALAATSNDNLFEDIRTELNSIAGPSAQIANLENKSSFLPKLNTINNLKATLPVFMPTLRVWYDFGDGAGLWQDTARTIPAATAGDPVAGLTDWSGTGNHAHQPTAPSQVTLATGANGLVGRLDGASDFFETVNTVNLSTTDKVTVSAAIRTAVATSASRAIVEHGINTTASFQLYAPRAAGVPDGAVFGSRGSGASYIQAGVDVGYPPPRSMVLTGLGDIAAPISRLRIDGTQVANLTTSQGTGNYGNYKMFFGSRAGTSFFFAGDIGNIMILAGFATDNQLRILKAINDRRLP